MVLLSLLMAGSFDRLVILVFLINKSPLIQKKKDRYFSPHYFSSSHISQKITNLYQELSYDGYVRLTEPTQHSYTQTHTRMSSSIPVLLPPMKHRHGHRTRYGHGHVHTCNVQNIKRSTGVVSVSNTDTDACRTPNTVRD